MVVCSQKFGCRNSTLLRHSRDLKLLMLDSLDQLPVLLSVVDERPFPLLRTLVIREDDMLLRQAHLTALSSSLKNSPALEEINFECHWERGACQVFLCMVGEGACHHLHALHGLPFPFKGLDEGYFHYEMEYDVDEAETEACIEALAETLEQRYTLDTCVGMKEVGGYWQKLRVEDPELLRVISTNPHVVEHLVDITIIENTTWQLSYLLILTGALATGAWPKLRCIAFRYVTVGLEGFAALLSMLSVRLTTKAEPLEEIGFHHRGAGRRRT